MNLKNLTYRIRPAARFRAALANPDFHLHFEISARSCSRPGGDPLIWFAQEGKSRGNNFRPEHSKKSLASLEVRLQCLPI
jgi:hypothetical protein